MKKIVLQLIKSKIVQAFFVMIGVVGFFEFIIFPGLTAANTLYNLISGIVALFVLIFVVFYIKVSFLDVFPDEHPLFEPELGKDPETELDYNPEILKPKTKRRPLIKVEVKKSTKKPRK